MVATAAAASLLAACGFDYVSPAPPEPMPAGDTTMIHLDDGSLIFVDKPRKEVAAILNEGPNGRALLREVDVDVYVVPNRVTALE